MSAKADGCPARGAGERFPLLDGVRLVENLAEAIFGYALKFITAEVFQHLDKLIKSHGDGAEDENGSNHHIQFKYL